VSRILVTGINSPLGQAVGRKLQAERHRVVGTVRSSKVNLEGLPADELVALDLNDKDSFTNIKGSYDSFVHLACISLGTPEDLMETTGLGTLHLVNRAVSLGIKRIIHISGMDAYGKITVPCVNENTRPDYQNPYGVAKWAAESYVVRASELIDGVSIRSPAIAGAKHIRHFLARTLQKMLNGDSIVEASNKDFCFNNIVHENILSNFVSKLISQSSFPESQALVVGSIEPMRLEEIIKYLATVTKFQGEINWVGSSTDPFSVDFSSSLAYGYEPITVNETLKIWTKELGLGDL
jgi:nucleoside-diphosphate-sugar epimerase